MIPIVWQKKKAEAALVMDAAEAAVQVCVLVCQGG